MTSKLLATTAIAVLLATGAYAQNATAPAASAPATTAQPAPTVRADGQIMSNIVGESVYDGTGQDAQNIGTVSDVLFDKDGKAKSVIIGVGGFLGVGSKDVAFDYGKMQWAEKNGDRWLVAETSKDALTKQPAFDTTPYEPKSQASNVSTMAPATGDAPATTAMAPATDQPAAGQPASGGTMAPANGGDTTASAPVETGGKGAAATPHADGELATNIMGEKVYNGTGDDAQNIGDVNDIVLDKAGQSRQLVIGVGGFLGLGEKNVAFDYDKVQPAEKNGDRWLVVQASKDDLQGLPDFDRKAYDPAPASTAAASDTSAMTTPAADTGQATATKDSATDATKTAAIDKSTLTEMPQDKISADTLMGTTVYGANDAKVGKIGDIVLSSDNKVDAVVIDVGGFLGIGSKPVAVGMDNLKFMSDKDGNNYLYTNFTKDQLNAQAAYDKGTYAQSRDKQRMMVQ